MLFDRLYIYIYRVVLVNFLPFLRPAVARVVCRQRNLIPFRTQQQQQQQQPETDKLCRVEEVLPAELGEHIFFSSHIL